MFFLAHGHLAVVQWLYTRIAVKGLRERCTTFVLDIAAVKGLVDIVLRRMCTRRSRVTTRGIRRIVTHSVYFAKTL